MISGIYLRVAALAGVAVAFYFYEDLSNVLLISLVFIFMSSFSLGGAFATVSYTDILGKSIVENVRKSFFSMRQIISAGGTLLSAWLAGYVLRHFEYPINYFTVFFIAAIGLCVASFSFWKVKETKIDTKPASAGFWKSIISELKSNRRLTYYLLLTNTLGLNYAILPLYYYSGNPTPA